MVNINLHRSFLVNILREIYADPSLRNALGFKGGTAAMLFYGLPRFSIDLDFDLLNAEKKEVVFKRLKEILPKFGRLRDASEKHYTLFFLLDYKKDERNLKIEISKRPSTAEYVVKSYLGISVLVMSEADMAAGKLAALLTRKRQATRDVYDIWFFLKNHWSINERFLAEKADMSMTRALVEAQKKVKMIKKTELLAGLGELLDNKQKAWAREKLIEDTVFYLRLYWEMLAKRV